MDTRRIRVFVLVVCAQFLVIAAVTNDNDLGALNALKSSWQNLPPNWKGADPCGTGWEGVTCNNSRVTRLDLSSNKGLRAPLPQSLGNLKNLTFLGLNNNSLTGPIPPSIGSLSRLSWLDLSENQLTGGIPVSSGTASGLDRLSRARHLRLDWNSFVGSVPRTLNSLGNVTELNLSNNNLTGPIPNLTALNVLTYVDMSNNSFNASAIPTWLTNLWITQFVKEQEWEQVTAQS
ncbi:hypothetical protein LguiA_008352 [Lonicera macranthoides]